MAEYNPFQEEFPSLSPLIMSPFQVIGKFSALDPWLLGEVQLINDKLYHLVYHLLKLLKDLKCPNFQNYTLQSSFSYTTT